MPVLPNQTHPFQDPQTLHHFLHSQCLGSQSLGSQSQARPSAALPLTIAFDIQPIDPLSVVQRAIDAGVAHFYLEKPAAGEALVGFGIAQRFTAEGAQRFQQLQRALSTQTAHLATPEERANYLFFGSFTFFDHDDANPAHQPPVPPAALVLPQWQIVRRQHHYRAIAHLCLPPYSHLEAFTETLWQQFQNLMADSAPRLRVTPDLPTLQPFWQTKASHNFADSVAAALRAIAQNHVNKLVLAHAIDVFSPIPFNVVQSLQNLRHWHPDCSIFSLNEGGSSTFLGASPETLVKIGDRQFATDALAGSAARGRTHAEDATLAQQLLHSPKERHEHQLVVDFLCDRLSRMGMIPDVPPAPHLLKLSNIQHLHTPIQSHLPAHLHPLDVLAQLHPTPAVAGMPPTIALDLIRRYEQIGRSRYAAPIGWLDANGNAEFIVGIRSAQLSEHQARLFAGAGIVAGSDPLREQAEVTLKLQALLRALA